MVLWRQCHYRKAAAWKKKMIWMGDTPTGWCNVFCEKRFHFVFSLNWKSICANTIALAGFSHCAGRTVWCKWHSCEYWTWPTGSSRREPPIYDVRTSWFWVLSRRKIMSIDCIFIKFDLIGNEGDTLESTCRYWKLDAGLYGVWLCDRHDIMV